MIRVLVVDDSAVVRRVLSEELSRFGDIEVVGTAVDPYMARDRIAELRPDVLTLDVEMPRMDGLSFLAKLMKHHPMPVVVVSSLTPENSENAMRALALGAVEVIPKPGSQFTVPDVGRRLVRAIRAAAVARVRLRRPAPEEEDAPEPLPTTLSTTHKVIGIGASTGGTQAIERVLRGLPANAPGISIVQHMPSGFTESFAQRLNGICPMTVREARDGDALVPGLALIAPGGMHLMVRRSGAKYVADVRQGPPVNRHKPSVDVLFRSLARSAGPNAVGVILTGMGADGAVGLLEMRSAGAHTIGQDEESSVVYGMPRAAAELGGAAQVLPLTHIASAVAGALLGQSVPEVPVLA
ncbi:MAG TPA: chemotaxis response regulator protein-glutamate methylesterase [Longimicrobiales bacterium]|nr:chemotaxis response regulator protein-glutamate methylesterase [Longimicrobiales bacterium]